MTKIIREGSRWWSGENKKFVVISVVETEDGHTWVHYREDKKANPKEYSCYIESFEARFSRLPE